MKAQEHRELAEKFSHADDDKVYISLPSDDGKTPLVNNPRQNSAIIDQPTTRVTESSFYPFVRGVLRLLGRQV